MPNMPWLPGENLQLILKSWVEGTRLEAMSENTYQQLQVRLLLQPVCFRVGVRRMRVLRIMNGCVCICDEISTRLIYDTCANACHLVSLRMND